MRTEKRDVYVCYHCGKAFIDKSDCRQHEIYCSDGLKVVYIRLGRDADGHFVFDCTLKVVTRDTYATYDEVYGWDSDCDYFAIVSEDTSEEHVKELKDKLIKKAAEAVKEYRDEQNQYYEGLLKELKDVREEEK